MGTRVLVKWCVASKYVSKKRQSGEGLRDAKPLCKYDRNNADLIVLS